MFTFSFFFLLFKFYFLILNICTYIWNSFVQYTKLNYRYHIDQNIKNPNCIYIGLVFYINQITDISTVQLVN